MPRKPKNKENERKTEETVSAHIQGAGIVEEQYISDTLETNYMPYCMSVIMSRAIPEIDGFKPSHRKLLYTMYKMNLLTGGRTKSANIVGSTMKLNPHGDSAIYETMVRLTRGHEALLHPYVDSKGNFGKAYSKNMQYAASRYTEAKLEGICAELFRDIDKETVDMVPNYDNTTTEPTLFPVTFPSVLVNSNMGIAVGMASNICSFNLREICDTTIALLQNPEHDLMQTLKAPDFRGGGQLIFEENKLSEIYETGRGSVRLRAKYEYDKANNCIDIKEIPATTTCEAIIDKIIELVKAGKLREISDIRDETDKGGLKITIDLKRGVDADKLMASLFRKTPLEDSFPANFNILIGGVPKVMGVREILNEWIAFRTECVRRRTSFDLEKAKSRLHLLRGLEKILLDIDKAIRIVRETEEEVQVVPNLMIGFGIDQTQAEYVAEIKLRHLNREFILKRLQDIEDLEKSIADMEDILAHRKRIAKIIISELQEVSRKYGEDRRTEIIYDADGGEEEPGEDVPDYPVLLFFTRDGYFKKITPQSWRMGSNHKLKDGDAIICSMETTNSMELLFFTNRQQVYKSRCADFEDTKASSLGDYVASKLKMEDGETAVFMAVTKNYNGYMLFFFENGKVAKVDMNAYATKQNRKKLLKAYNGLSPAAAFAAVEQDSEFVISTSSGRLLLFDSASVNPKTTKDTQGVAVMKVKKGHRVISAVPYTEGRFIKPARYRAKTLPSMGVLLAAEDTGEQLTL